MVGNNSYHFNITIYIPSYVRTQSKFSWGFFSVPFFWFRFGRARIKASKALQYIYIAFDGGRILCSVVCPTVKILAQFLSAIMRGQNRELYK